MAPNSAVTGAALRERLISLFDAAREQSGCQNAVEVAKKLYTKVDDNEMFLIEFIHVLKYCFIYSDKSGASKMLLFAAKFAASLYGYKALMQDSADSEDLEHPFVNGLLTFLFQTHSAVSSIVRHRCTTLINYILNAMPEDSWLPVSIWNGLAELTKSRLQDRVATVRAAAALVAKKLQEPKDPNCEIVKLLSFHMVDPSPSVRRAVVTSIALSKVTIGAVIERTLDVDDNVRRNAFAVLAKVRFQNLTIAQRITLLENGLNDRVEKVRRCVESVVIAQWVDQMNKNILGLLEGLDVVNCSDIASLAVEAIIKIVPIEELIENLKIDSITHLIPLDDLTPETALLWKVLIQHASKENLCDCLENILPNITAFCDCIKEWQPLDQDEPDPSTDPWLELKRKHVLIHLIELAKYFDLVDEVGRKNLRKQIIAMLISPKVNGHLADKLIELLNIVEPDVNSFLLTCTEIISEIREPLTQVAAEQPIEVMKQQEVALSAHKLALNELREREYEAVNSKDYAAAAELNSKITALTQKINDFMAPATLSEVREEKTDPETVCKCLRILVKMIPCSKIKQVTAGLKYLQEDFLSSCLTSEDLMTQSLAIQALGQFCILDRRLAQEHLIGFLLMLSENGEDEINIPALKAVFDILQISGTQRLNNIGKLMSTNGSNAEDINCSQVQGDELDIPAEKCVTALKELMNSTTNEKLKLTAFEGFCKMLYNSVVYSPSLLKTILLKGFSPIKGNEVDDRMRQLFMVFFPSFARQTSRSQEMIEAAFLPVVRTLLDAGPKDPERKIDPMRVMEFLIDSTRPGINPLTNHNVHIHNNLALAICNEIVSDIGSNNFVGVEKNYLKALTHLQLSHDSEFRIQELRALAEKIQKSTCDLPTRQLLKKFQDSLKPRGESVASIQNTLQNSSIGNTGNTNATSKHEDNSTLSTLFVSKVASLSAVVESEENTLIDDADDDGAVSKPVGMVIAESPDVSDDEEEEDE